MTTPPDHGQQPTATSADPWPAIDELASLINDLASQVLSHTTTLERLLSTSPMGAGATGGEETSRDGACNPSGGEVNELRAWVEALVDEYGLHGHIGPPKRWENIPPLRAELLGLKIADPRSLELKQGSFELVYWHDALARVLDRAPQHADRWQQDQDNQRLLQST